MFGKKEEIIIRVNGMSCSHCAGKVISSLEDIPSVERVKVNLDKKQVKIISSEKIEERIIKEKIESLDYDYLGIEER